MTFCYFSCLGRYCFRSTSMAALQLLTLASLYVPIRYVHFWDIIYPLLHPSLENLTTGIPKSIIILSSGTLPDDAHEKKVCLTQPTDHILFQCNVLMQFRPSIIVCARMSQLWIQTRNILRGYRVSPLNSNFCQKRAFQAARPVLEKKSNSNYEQLLSSVFSWANFFLHCSVRTKKLLNRKVKRN